MNCLPNKFQAWLYAIRLRTLPLAFSCILVGSFCAFHQSRFRVSIMLLSLLTTLLLQILSNLANDYGDSKKGTDNAQRIGPKRAVQAGLLSYSEIQLGMVICSIFTLLSGSMLIYLSLASYASYALLFLVLGLAAMAAAIKYTIGKGAYGYHGLGDVFVFLFFGLVGVVGSYFLQTKIFNAVILLPAITIGCFACGVLNLNNLRDRASDAIAGKNTWIVRIGDQAGRVYHFTLIIFGWLAVIAFCLVTFRSSMQFLFVLAAPLFWKHLMAVKKVADPKDYDPLLKQLALASFIFSMLFSLGLILSPVH